MLPRLAYAVTGALLFLCVPTLQAEAEPPRAKIDRAVRASLASGAHALNIIITVNAGCRQAVRAALVKHGHDIDADFTLIDAVAAEVHGADIAPLAASACVRAISADADVRATAQVGNARSSSGSRNASAEAVELQPSQTLISTLRDTLGLPHQAHWAPAVPTGRNIGIAIVDSGIALNADFEGRITAFYDYTRGTSRKTSRPYDDFGHGTHIAGLIGSSGALTNGEFQGVAPGAHFAVFKVLDRTGAGKTTDVIRAIEFIVANRRLLDVQVINLSLGHPIFAPAADDPLVQAVERATAAGLIVVASAGNFGQKESDGTVGYAGITSPGNAPSAITVGAAMTKDTISRLDDEVAPYSSRGPTWFDARVKPDVVAPGHRLASDTNLSSYLYELLNQSRGESRNGQPLLLLSGSSMATAVTSGVVALALQAHEESPLNRWGMTANLVKGILQYSAVAIDGADYLTQGAGQVNAAGAIALGRAIDTSRPIGSTWLSNVTPFTEIGGASYSWARHVIYGETVLSGNLLSANNIVWSSNIVWGSALAEGDNIVWGTAWREADNIVWGTNVIWGTNIVWGTTIELDNIVWGTAFRELDNIVWGTGIR